MSRVEALKAEIEKLPKADASELLHWLAERDWEGWDKEIEADSQSGRLDFLTREAREEKFKDRLKAL